MKRAKASFHVHFPQIIVDRPVKAYPEAPGGALRDFVGWHVLLRDHVVCCFLEQEESEDSRDQESLSFYHKSLEEACEWAKVNPDDEDDNSRCLNAWSEIFDERPLWHEPSPGRCTGFRLPFTDKPLEGRPKLPLGRWRCAQQDGCVEVRRCPDVDPVEWVRLGDISVCHDDITPLDRSTLHPNVDLSWGYM